MNKKANSFFKQRCVVVTSLDEARAAVASARHARVPTLLITEPGACARLGPAFLLEMVHQAGIDDDNIRALINCGPDAGYAMLALRVGWKDLHVTGRADTVRRIAEMTESAGGRFHSTLPRQSMAVDQSLARDGPGDASN